MSISTSPRLKNFPILVATHSLNTEVTAARIEGRQVQTCHICGDLPTQNHILLFCPVARYLYSITKYALWADLNVLVDTTPEFLAFGDPLPTKQPGQETKF